MGNRRPASLKKLERTLNTDKRVRSAFLKDPAKIMRREGVELSQDQVESVKSQIADMKLQRLLASLTRQK